MTDIEYKSLWDKGIELLDGRINLDGNPLPKPGFFERRRLHKASVLFERAASVAPENAAPLLFLGKIEERLGNAEACVDWLKRANELEPNNLIVVLELGGALGRSGKHAESASVMMAVARSHPNDPRIHVNLGLSLLMAGEANDAVQAFEHVVKLEPDLPANRRLLSFAVSVANGTKAAPRSLRELSANI